MLRGSGSLEADPEVAARVNGNAIGASEYEQAVERLAHLARKANSAVLLAQAELASGKLKRAVGEQGAASAFQSALEQLRQEGPTAWFQAYLPGEDDTITRMVERVARAGYDTLVLTVDVQVAANRENNVRSGFYTPLRPSLRLAWDGLIRPRWLLGMLARTLILHGMPHFENMGPRVPLISRTGERGRGRRDQLPPR